MRTARSGRRPVLLALAAVLCTAASAQAQIVVTDAGDAVDPATGVTLREAILLANATPGSTITFDPALAGGTITLAAPLPLIEQDVTIDASGAAPVTVDGDGANRAFFVRSGDVTLNNLTVQNTLAEGGDATAGGAGGAGGGLGAGGALFVNEGADVTLVDVSFQGNAAAGGDGDDDTGAVGGSNGGGGGGGLGGDGGAGGGAGGGGGGLQGDGGAGGPDSIFAGGGGGGGFGDGTGDNSGLGGEGGAGTVIGVSTPTPGTDGEPQNGGGGGGGTGQPGGLGAGTAGNGGPNAGGGGGGGEGGADAPAVSPGPRPGGDGGFGGGGGGGGFAGSGGNGGDFGGGGGSNGRDAGDGGYGGGGGGGDFIGPGGDGGFGGGGGAGDSPPGSLFAPGTGGGEDPTSILAYDGDPASGPTLGGDGGETGGGGGAGLGGAVFVRQGGSLTVINSARNTGEAAGTVAGGAGAGDGEDGAALGGALYLDDTTATFAPQAGLEFTVADSVAGRRSDPDAFNVEMRGEGLLRLSGANTYTGRTLLDNGVVAIDDDMSLGLSRLDFADSPFAQNLGTAVFQGGTLRSEFDVTLNNDFNLLDLGPGDTGGTIDTAGNTLTHNGVVFGDGALTKVGAGTLVLGARPGQINRYGGGTNLFGGTVSVADETNLGTGPLVFDGGTLLTRANVLFDLDRDPATAAADGIRILSFGVINDGGNLSEIAVTIDGPGTLVKAGTGRLILSAPNTYLGGTIVGAGTLQVDTTSLPTGPPGNGVQINPAAALLFQQPFDGTYAGDIVDGGLGGGLLQKRGGGEVTLTGNNLGFTGRIAVEQGALRGDTVSLPGNGPAGVSEGAALILDQTVAGPAFNGVYDGDILGPGELIKENAGTVLLNGNTALTGATRFRGGALAFNRALSVPQGPLVFEGGTAAFLAGGTFDNPVVVDAADAVVSVLPAPTDVTLSGPISGANGLIKVDPGTLRITDTANDYAGLTQVLGGELFVNSFSLPGDAFVDAGTRLTFDQTAAVGDGVFNDLISGPGAVRKAGAATLTIDGTQTYTGGTFVDGGTLLVEGRIGDVAANRGGTLGGTGTVGDLLVNPGGTVSPGAPPSPTDANSQFGVLTVDGDAAFRPGSRFAVDITPAEVSDRLDVSGATRIDGGTVTVDAQPGRYRGGLTYTLIDSAGGVDGVFDAVTDNLDFFDAQLVYSPTLVQLVLARGGVTFADRGRTFNQRSAGRALDLAGNPTDDLVFILDRLDELNGAALLAGLDSLAGEIYANLPYVRFQVADHHNRMVARELRPTWLGPRREIYRDLASADSLNNDFAATLTGLLGAGRPAAGGGVTVDGADFSGTGGGIELAGYCPDPLATDGLGFGPSIATPTVGTFGGAGDPGPMVDGWVRGFGVGGRVDSDFDNDSVDFNFGGLQFGATGHVADGLATGVNFAWTHASAGLDDLPGDAEITSYAFGTHSRLSAGRFYALTSSQFSYDEYDISRSIQFGSVNRSADGETSGTTVSYYGELGATYRVGITDVQPLFAAQYVGVDRSSFTETGTANAARLSFDSEHEDSARTILGGRLLRRYLTGTGVVLLPELRAFYTHEFTDTDRFTSAEFLGGPGASFAIRSAVPGRDNAVLGGGLTVSVAERLGVFGHYDASFSGRDQLHAGTGGLVVTW